MATKTFQNYIDEIEIKGIEIIETDDTTHTAQDAADTHDVDVSNIVKSLLISDGNDFFLVLVPGDRRLDLKRISTTLDLPTLRMSTADEAKSVTGYSIGGVPPFGHNSQIETFIIEGFDKENVLVAAAGSAKSVFKVDYNTLITLTNGKELSI